MADAGEKNNSGPQNLRSAVRERTIGYIVGALSLVAGLAWNDAVHALIESIFPLQGGTLPAKFAYAFLVTIAVVIFTVYLSRIFQDNGE